MTLDEVSTLLDSKLEPLARDLGDVKRHLFGNGGLGLRERIGQIEQECRRRGEIARESRVQTWTLRLTAAGWIVTLIVFALELLARQWR